MDIRSELEKIINEESMTQKANRAEALKGKIQMLKTDGRRSCDAEMPELRGDCYQRIADRVRKAEISLHKLSS